MRKIEPIRIFELFGKISEIPRCTGDEEGISTFVVEFAKNLGLDVSQDRIGNVIINKPGSKGYESAAPIILQGHMDMLCIKSFESMHDFSSDPLELNVSGDLLVADKTALGSDNGIAIAFYLALLESDSIAHPPLEVILTVQEQAGLIGARELDVSKLYGRYLINMDSEAEGEFIIGCAGEERVRLDFPFDRTSHEYDMESTITIQGLKGGHSGLNIHLNRGNAVQILAKVFKMLSEEMPVSLISMCAGEKHNVIPHYGELRIAFPHDSAESFKEKMIEVHKFMEPYLNEVHFEFGMDLCPIETKVQVLKQNDTDKLINLLLTLPNGVIAVSERESELVDTSLNIGILRVYEDQAVISISIRGLTYERLISAKEKVEVLSQLVGAHFTLENSYPAWNDEGDNHLRRIFKQAYREQYDEEPSMKSIHAGLECSILAKKLNERYLQPPIEMISFGPDIFDAHTPDEAMSISSVRRMWGLFQYILKQMIE